MKILMISPLYPWPATTGGLVRIDALFKGLSNHHEVTLLSPIENIAPTATMLPRYHQESSLLFVPVPPRSFLGGLSAATSSRPYHVALYYKKAMARKAAKLVESMSFSLVYCNFIYSLPYIPAGSRIPVVLDQHNVDREYWMRKVISTSSPILKVAAWINLHKTIAFENKMLDRVTGIVSVSDLDMQKTMAYANSRVSRFIVAPNGVDLGHYIMKPFSCINKHVVLGFMGSFDLQINQTAALWLCRELLPKVRARLQGQQVSVLLIGRNPPESILSIGRKDPTVYVTGIVADVRPFLELVDIFVGPIKGGAGTKLRVLEAMAVGLPVVGSPYLFDGFSGIRDGANSIIANSVEDFCGAIIRLARDPNLRQQMGRQARLLVERQYSWEQITGNLALELEQFISN